MARSPLALRRCCAATAAAIAVGVLALGLSDAVPGGYRRLMQHAPLGVRRLPLLSFSSVWGLHFVAFGLLTFLVVLALRRWSSRVGAAAGLLAFGWLLEVGQERLSTVRAYQTVDLEADVRGIVVAFTAAACLLTLRSCLALRPARVAAGSRPNRPR